MKTNILLGIVLCCLGVIGLAYGGFSYTHRETVFEMGPIHATAAKRETIPIAPIVGVLALVGGAALIIAGTRK